jgi:hypothetical protein
MSKAASSDPYVIAARALAFAEEEWRDGRTVSIAQAVRHVEKHGYPAKTTQAASFAEAGEYSTANILSVAAELARSDPSLTHMEAVQRVSLSVRQGKAAGSKPVAFGERADLSVMSRLWLNASLLSDKEPGLTFSDALRRVAEAAGFVVHNQCHIERPPTVAASFGEAPAGAADGARQLCFHRAAVQLQRLCPGLTYEKARRQVGG